MRASLAVLVLVLTLSACAGEDVQHDPPTVGAPVDPAGPALTDDYDCGHGFARADEQEQVMLLLRLDHDAPPALDRTVRLPDPDWDVTVRLGSDLGANWCSDVIEDPQAEVAETWEVVEGTLRFLGQVPRAGSGAGDPDVVRAELTGAVAVSPDGERVELDDVPLRNDLWGFYAG